MPKRKAKPKRKATTSTSRTKKKPAARARAKGGARRQPAARGRRTGAGGPTGAVAERIVAVTLANDDDATLALYADDIESAEPGRPPMTGIEAIKQKLSMWRGMTSAASFRARHVVVTGNVVMIEWEGTVTLAATGRTIQLNEVAVHEIEGGKIVRERFYYDPSAFQS